VVLFERDIDIWVRRLSRSRDLEIYMMSGAIKSKPYSLSSYGTRSFLKKNPLESEITTEVKSISKHYKLTLKFSQAHKYTDREGKTLVYPRDLSTYLDTVKIVRLPPEH